MSLAPDQKCLVASLTAQFCGEKVRMGAKAASEAAQIVAAIQAGDPSAGVALLDESGEILWENEVQIENFGDGTGDKCYAFYNHFREKCKWCRLDHALTGHQIEVAQAVSPSSTLTSK